MGSANLIRPLCSFAISSHTVALKFSDLALPIIYHSILHWVLSFPLVLLFPGFSSGSLHILQSLWNDASMLYNCHALTPSLQACSTSMTWISHRHRIFPQTWFSSCITVLSHLSSNFGNYIPLFPDPSYPIYPLSSPLLQPLCDCFSSNLYNFSFHLQQWLRDWSPTFRFFPFNPFLYCP